ncbi:MAG: hypothetical protein PF570_07630 [Candidatus Cloacimonetes bacterium]|jgi:hypothetical protein|nr:hypothetical protein [Candidatus Cloacimonadota bacterium]
MKILKNNKGYSLIEIIAGLPLVTLVFVIFGIGIVHFVTTFQEITLYTQLQDDLFNAIEIMRHGYMVEDVTDDEGLIGLTTAKKVTFSSSRNYIWVYPLALNPELEESYKVKFLINNDMQLETEGIYGLNNYQGKMIFPSTPIKYIGREPQFTIKNPREIWKYSANSDNLMIDIKLVGQVRFREKMRNQSTEDDIRKNTRTITYETSVFLGNSHAEVEEE